MVDGKELGGLKAIVESAKKYGLDNYPSFGSEAEAQAWIDANHGKIKGSPETEEDREIASFFERRGQRHQAESMTLPYPRAKVTRERIPPPAVKRLEGKSPQELRGLWDSAVLKLDEAERSGDPRRVKKILDQIDAIEAQMEKKRR